MNIEWWTGEIILLSQTTTAIQDHFFRRGRWLINLTHIDKHRKRSKMRRQRNISKLPDKDFKIMVIVKPTSFGRRMGELSQR